MSLTFKCYPERKLTVFTLRGEPTLLDILRVYRDAKEQHGLTKHTIWDGREAAFSHITSPELERLNEMVDLIQRGDRARIGGRSAILVASQEDARVFLAYKSLNFRLPQRFKVVFSLSEAYAWVEGQATVSYFGQEAGEGAPR